MENMTQAKQTIPWYKTLINTLISPSSAIQDVGQRNQARLLAGVSLLMAVVVLLGAWGSYSMHPSVMKVGLLIALAVSALVAYIFSRTRQYVAGTLIFLFAFSAFGYISAVTGSDDPSGAVLMSMPLAFLIGIALLSFRGMIVLAIVNMIVPFLLPLLFKGIPNDFALNVFGQILAMGGLSALVVATRDNIERDRLNELRGVNKELQDLSMGLEQHVAERTREIGLAAEIGRRVSSMHDLDTLLNEAVNLIRDHFNLYYTQIYLTNSTGSSLLLRAGTGEVGRELLRHAHRLMVDLTSINGSAVVERRPVVVENTRKSLIFRPNALLPETRSEMSIPLVSGERVLGVLNLQSNQAGDLSQEKLPVFETVAAQLATALANAELFAQVQQTLAEIEDRSRGVAREGWNEYLDGIQAKERIGYAYDQVSVQPLNEPLPTVVDPCVLTAPIQISGAPVGTFQFSADRPWRREDVGVVNTVAQLVAQQIENLRLLGQAERYRQEAEKAVRRLTQQEWGDYLKLTANQKFAFEYAQDQVQPLEDGLNGKDGKQNFEIKVQGEKVGELAFPEIKDLTPEDAELVAAVSEQLGAHLENMRLFSTAQEELEERRRTESALDEQRRTLQAVLDNMPAGVFMVEAPSGKPILSNKKAEEFLGRGISPTAGEDNINEVYQAYKFGTEELYPGQEMPIVAGLYGQSKAISDMEVRRPDGSRVLLEVTGTPVYADGDRLVASLVMFQDITERHKSELQLADQQRTLQAVLDNMPAGVFMVEAPSGKPVLSNKKAEEFLGRGISPRASEDNINEVYQAYKFGTEELYPGQEMPIVAGLYGQAKSINDMEVRRPDGTRVLLEVTGTPVYDGTNKLISSLVMFQDITERHKAELQLESQQRTLQAVLDNMPAGVFMVEAPSGKPVLSNKKAEEFLGRGISPKAVGEDLNEVYQAYKFGTGELYPAQEMPIVAGLSGEARSINDMEVVRPDGSRVLLQVNGAPIQDADGHVVAAVVLFQDITENKILQDTITKRAAELATVSQLATAVSTIQSPDEMLQTVVDLTKTSFELYHAHVYLINETGDMLNLAKGAGEVGRQMVTEGRFIAMSAEKSLVARAARTRQGVIVNDVRQDPEFLPHPLLPKTRSEMAVPMLVGDRVLGVLDIQSETVDRFTDEDVSIQTTLASQVAVALQNARQYAQAREALAQANLFRELVEAAGQGIWVTTMESNIIYANSSVAKMLGEEPGKLMPKGTDYIPADEQARTSADLLGGLRTIGQWSGELDLVAPKTGRRIPTINHIRAIQQGDSPVPLFANIITDITEQRQAYEITRRLAGAHSLDEILKAVVENSFLKEFDNSMLYFFNHPWKGDNIPDALQIMALWEDIPNSSYFRPGQVLPLSVFPGIAETEGTSVTWAGDVATTTDIPEVDREVLLKNGIRSIVKFRIVIGDEWIGDLSGSSAEPKEITKQQVQRLSSLMEQAATVMQNLRLLEAVQARARREQMLREVTAHVRNSMDPDTILRTAVRELGNALGRQTFIRIGSAEQLVQRPEQNDDSPTNGHSTSGMNGEGGK